MSHRTVLAMSVMLSATQLSAQTVVGTVSDEVDGRPIPGAVITLQQVSGEVVSRSETDGTGRYAVRAPDPGEYKVVADFLGYERLESPLVRMEAARTVSVDFDLPVDPIEVEGLRVEVDRQREVRRRVLQYGVDIRHLGQRFVSRREIQRRETASNFGQVLQWQNVAGMSVRWSEIPPLVCVILGGRGRSGCALMVLDGQVIDEEYAHSVPPQSLETIVVLTPIEATLSFGTDASAGAVLLFTTGSVRGSGAPTRRLPIP